ncbi:MAG: hypothetical protein ABR498_04800 [Candidatus Dormibacteria bacterium]
MLGRIETDGDPRLEAEVLHARGNALRGTNLKEATALLGDAADGWERLGDETKHAWALCNRGMALFDLGLIADAAHDHQEALDIFMRIGDRAGASAAGNALALERPDDPRVPEWLTQSLQLAEESGDLAKERNALITLAWFRFIRAHLGDDDATAEARRVAERLARVSAEMGDVTFEVQAHCLLAVLDRLRGDIDAAVRHTSRARSLLQTSGDNTHQYSGALMRAVDFMLRLAQDRNAAGCPAPAQTPSPLAVMSDVLVIEALLLSGRYHDARDQLQGSTLGDFASISPFFARMLTVVRASALLFTGSEQPVEDQLMDARDAAQRLGAHANAVAATALLAEVLARSGDIDGAHAHLRDVGDDPGGFAGLLLRRARAAAGDNEALRQLSELAEKMKAPGCLLPTGAYSSASTK